MPSKKGPAEFRALLSEDANVVRGRIPAPLVKLLGGKAGDYMVFKYEGGKATVSVSRAKKPAAKKAAAKKTAKKR